MDIGAAIQAIRKKLNVTQKELAAICELSQTSLSQIENGVKRPSQQTIDKICATLDIPEAIIYIIALQETDVPKNKRSVYTLVYPSLIGLALQMVGDQNGEM